MDNIKLNKVLNEKYFLLKDIANKYNYSEELLDIITFVYVSFYMNFGKSCDYPLYDLFNKVKIIYESGSVDEISLRNGFGKISSGSAAVTIFTPNLKVFKDPSLKQNPQIILLGTHVGEYSATPALKLEMLTHEIRHALMGYYNTNILLDKNTYYMRSGLNETYYFRYDNLEERFFTKILGNTLDEITNTYLTEILVNRIMSFKKYRIDNNSLNAYLNSVNTSQFDGRYRAIGYNSEVKLLYPLLLNEEFVRIVDKYEFNGEISIIKSFIEDNTSICNYEYFSSLLDKVFENNCKYVQEVENNNVDFIKHHIEDISEVKMVVMDISKSLKKKSISSL